MKNPLLAFSILPCLLGCPVFAGPVPREAADVASTPAAALPSGEEVMDRYVEVTGGRSAYEKIRNRAASGTLEFAGTGLAGPISIWQSVPDRIFMEAEIEGLGRIRAGSDGRVVWEMNSMIGPRVLQGVEREVVLRSSTLNAELNWREFFPKAECVGTDVLDGRKVYEVRLTPQHGKPVTGYYDAETGLLSKTAMVLETQMGEVPTETYVGDYKEVGGVRLPHSIREEVMGMEQVMTFDEIEQNVDIPPERFALPAEVRALVDKLDRGPAPPNDAPETESD